MYSSRRKDSQDFRSSPLGPRPLAVTRRLSRQTVILLILAGITIVLVVSHYPLAKVPSSDYLNTSPPRLPLKKEGVPKLGPYHPTRVLKGPPTDSFRDNLLPDVQYITGWIGGGHTNDFMTYINYIYLGLLTRRVPILGPFAPTHVGRDDVAGFIPFGDIYDVERMATELGFPIVEWRDVKKPKAEGQSNEAIGGWTVYARYDTIRTGLPRGNHIVSLLGLEVSYTRAHEGAKLIKDEPTDAHVSFLEVARLSTNAARRAIIEGGEQPFVSEGPLAVKLPPDEHLMVIDFAFYIGMVQKWEWEQEYSEPWRIASHAHWTPRMQSLGEAYLMRNFGVKRVSDIPRFIVIHARHFDFGWQCGDIPLEDCFTPLSAIAVRVKEVQDELAQRKEFRNPDGSPVVLPVFMTSDETDPKWWADVKALGWRHIDHGPEGEDTVSKYGVWYPLLIDAVIQSMGHGLVGTDGSTMSYIAARRVETWQRGATRVFHWGRKGADDHPTQTKTTRVVPNNRFY